MEVLRRAGASLLVALSVLLLLLSMLLGFLLVQAASRARIFFVALGACRGHLPLDVPGGRSHQSRERCVQEMRKNGSPPNTTQSNEILAIFLGRFRIQNYRVERFREF